MPIEKKFELVFNEALSPAAKICGMECLRADQISAGNIINKDIFEKIDEAKVIIADLTHKNPNIFYEIGVSHTLPKRIILISQRPLGDIVFDLKFCDIIEYKPTANGLTVLSQQLIRLMGEMSTPSYKPDTPWRIFVPNHPLNRLYHVSELVSIEMDAVRRVDVLATRLVNDFEIFFKAIKKNIEREITYRYLLSNEQGPMDDFRKLKRALHINKKNQKYIQGRSISASNVECDIVLYDPDISLKGFIIPSGGAVLEYCYEIVQEHLFRIKQRFDILWKKAAPL